MLEEIQSSSSETNGCRGWSQNLAPSNTISLCMIVRDEEELLSRCLKSVQGIVHEIIIVDTGSKDNTVQIAHSFGAKVFNYTWCNDFAAARNFSISHASSEWILVLDADEMLTPKSQKSIQKIIIDNDCIGLVCILEDHQDTDVFYATILRVFRNIEGIRYERSYHEELNISDTKCKIANDLVVYHDGYTRHRMKEKRKLERALGIMKKYLIENSNDYYIQCKLAFILRDVGQSEEALTHAKQALNNAMTFSPSTLIYHLEAYVACGTISAQLGKWEEAQTYLSNAINLNIQNIYKLQAIIPLTRIYIEKNDYDAALLIATTYLPYFPESYTLHLYLAWSLIHVPSPDFPRAINHINTAITITSRDFAAWNMLGHVHLKQENYREAAIALEKAILLSSDEIDNYFHAGWANFLIGNFANAKIIFLKGINVATEKPDIITLNKCQDCIAQIENLEKANSWSIFYEKGGQYPSFTGCFDRISAFLIDRNLHILEIGCGAGNLARTISDVSASYLGVDVSYKAIQQLKFWDLQGHQLEIQALLPFDDNSWQCVIASQILEYVDDDYLLVEEAYRILKSGGWLIVAVLAGAGIPNMPKPRRAYDSDSLECLLKTVASQDVLWMTYFEEIICTEELGILQIPMLLVFVKKVD
ncbi:glycosyltransferase [Anthocerotibacter panamensis]|uniref:glycosyltransferase n=1 Tax=Anthocerotibacter panamensis TaxID=2857077 RepID=UPI001C401FB6|nr:glycosyltransferase [Anthocerotibacter panamensis]